MRQAAMLIRDGVPYDIVMKMSAVRRIAWIVAFGETDGSGFTYDWEAAQWKAPPPP